MRNSAVPARTKLPSLNRRRSTMPSTRARTSDVRYACTRPGSSITFGTACVRIVTILTSGGGGAGGASDEQEASNRASAAPAAQPRGRKRLIRTPEKSQLCGKCLYAKACVQARCNLNYKNAQGRGKKLGKSESAVCQMDRLSPRERRQGAILDAAEALFLEQGYERTSLAEIVKLSGGSLATLYELFGNKQGLLRAIATRWSDDAMLRSLDDDATKTVSSGEILKRYAYRQKELMESPHSVALMRMLISESLRDHEFAMQIYLDLHVPALEELDRKRTRLNSSHSQISYVVLC